MSNSAPLLAGVLARNAVTRESLVLVVAAGDDPAVFELTRSAKLVFAVDQYGSRVGAPATMLTDAAVHAPSDWEPNRLVVQYMDNLDLRFETETFDLVLCPRPLTEFVDPDGGQKALRGMARVCRVGGELALVRGTVGEPQITLPGLHAVHPAPEGLVILRKARRNA
jgi:SAM-dependent methyltransferase